MSSTTRNPLGGSGVNLLRVAPHRPATIGGTESGAARNKREVAITIVISTIAGRRIDENE